MPAMFGWFKDASTSASRLKPRQAILVSGERWRQDLDRDLAFQLRVRGAKHLAHPRMQGVVGLYGLFWEARAR